MEGVGARLGRSSTRYGPATVFNGPVRKWKKKWVPVSTSSSSSSAHHHSHSHSHHQSTATANGGVNNNNNNNASHLLLYKWAPISTTTTAANDDSAAASELTPPKKKFKYIPIAVLEEQKKEDMEDVDEEDKPSEADPSERTSKSEDPDGKPDMNDLPMEEAQAPEEDQAVPQDLNEASLDLSLGLKGHDGETESDPKSESQGKEAE